MLEVNHPMSSNQLPCSLLNVLIYLAFFRVCVGLKASYAGEDDDDDDLHDDDNCDEDDDGCCRRQQWLEGGREGGTVGNRSRHTREVVEQSGAGSRHRSFEIDPLWVLSAGFQRLFPKRSS